MISKNRSNIECVVRVLRNAWPKRFAILDAFIWNLFSSAAKFAQIAFIKSIVDIIVAQGSIINIFKYFLLLVGCIIVMTCTDAIHRWKMSIIIQRLTLDLQNLVHHKLHLMSDNFLNIESPGELTFRTLNDTAAFQQIIGIIVGTVISQGLVIIALSIYLLYLQWQIALMAILGYLIMVPIIRYITRPLQTKAKELQEIRAGLQQRFLNLLAGRDVIRCFGSSNKQIESLPMENDRFHITAKKYLTHRGIIDSLLRIGTVVFAMLIVLYIGWSTQIGKINPGTAAAVIAILFTFYKPITRIAQTSTNLRESIVSAQRVFEILDAPEHWQDQAGQIVPEDRLKNIKFDKVCYHVAGRNFTLHDLSFSLKAGEIVLFVGPTGCGKSTIVRLIITALIADSGIIKFNGLPSNQVSWKWLWNNLAYIPQQCPAIGHTIREELDLNSQGISEKELEEATRKTELYNWIRELPEVWETRIGANGVTLSGGQRQRLALARMFLAYHSLYVLDEPTSQLDQETEKRIITSLCQHVRRQNAMCIVVSHRPGFLDQVDRILTFCDGTIFELPKKDYADLYRLKEDDNYGKYQEVHD